MGDQWHASRRRHVAALPQDGGILLTMTHTEDVMTAAIEVERSVIEEALRLIDAGLSDLMHRELVSTDEVSDLLLDVRMLLTAAEMASHSEPLVEAPVGA
jgi:hypothetical protein